MAPPGYVGGYTDGMTRDLDIGFIGGLIRDHDGMFLGGLTEKLGVVGGTRILEVELWGIFKLLKFIQEKGIRKAIVYCDSDNAVSLVNRTKINRKVDPIVQLIKNLIKTPDFKFIVEKIQGDTNFAAHLLAKQAVMSNVDHKEYRKPPTAEIADVLDKDRNGHEYRIKRKKKNKKGGKSGK